MLTHDAAKSLAIATHAAQAEQFASFYAAADPFASCFNYSRFRLDEILYRLLPAPSVASKILDIGCGTGHQMKRLASMGYAVSGVDGSPEMLGHATRNNPGATLRQADVESLPFDAATFDAVISIEVLRYLPDPRQSIREMARVLKPGGVAVVTATPVLNLNGYAIINRLATMGLPGFVRLRQYFTTSRRLRRQFQDAGFREVQIHGVYWGPINWVERLARSWTPAFLRRWLPIDRLLADARIARQLSNMFVVRAIR